MGSWEKSAKGIEWRRQYQKGYYRTWYLSNKEKKNAQSRAWRIAHPERTRQIVRDCRLRKKRLAYKRG